ncbi:nucleotidyltransferase domain-containing protein [Methylobacterium sp. 77]|uniref:nucleotidyltransferase domain-containing protein n=1 Tax=Methylobacterium sp. 77 TaxID=1101192 RepID=UPI00047DD5AD|nr:nucleotidyltransferase domain-containing protein [Methylobacterium sp. 77]
MSVPPCPSPSEALTIAGTILRERYPGACFAFVAGSIMRGEGTNLSDIDLVIVFEALEAARRESFTFNGVPVEAFVHDPGTLAWFINDDAARGRPSILNMIAEGHAIGRALNRAETLRDSVSIRLRAGPPALTQAELDVFRYEITDAVDDLRGERNAPERQAIGIMLYPKMAELALRGRGQWSGVGKWLPRLLAKNDQTLGDRFDTAFRALFGAGQPDPVIALAESELAPHGGRLFDGDRRTAPANWRA